MNSAPSCFALLLAAINNDIDMVNFLSMTINNFDTKYGSWSAIASEDIRAAILDIYTRENLSLPILLAVLAIDSELPHPFISEQDFVLEGFRYFFVAAAEAGCMPVLKYLFENPDGYTLINKKTLREAFLLAIQNKQVEVINYLPILANVSKGDIIYALVTSTIEDIDSTASVKISADRSHKEKNIEFLMSWVLLFLRNF